MRLPIKLNKAGWPSAMARLSFAFDDPRPLAYEACTLSPHRFSSAVSTLQFGATFKTTFPGRQGYSNQLLLRLYRDSKPVILDVGASDGSTSRDLIQVLEGNFARYFVTDLNISARCGCDRRGAVYFQDANGVCVLRASQRLLAYSNVSGAPHPLRFIARRMIAGSRHVGEWRNILLIQPELLKMAERDTRITAIRYDMFTAWTGQPPNLIKVANLLNSKYFSDDQMKAALRVQCSQLAPNGRLLLVSEDDNIEKFSLFRKTSVRMLLEHTHAGGAKAARHVPVDGIVTPTPVESVLSAQPLLYEVTKGRVANRSQDE
ncbi:MAG: hypothetical protein ACREQX_04285 [Candidatus Binataceae bacterium]